MPVTPAVKAMSWVAKEIDRLLALQNKKMLWSWAWAFLACINFTREQGLDVQVFEAGSDVGGLGLNRYPGAVSIESMAYSFSFSMSYSEWNGQKIRTST